MVNTETTEGGAIVRAKYLARKYDVSERAVQLWAARGVIPSIRIGGKTLRFRLSDVVAKLEGEQ